MERARSAGGRTLGDSAPLWHTTTAAAAAERRGECSSKFPRLLRLCFRYSIAVTLPIEPALGCRARKGVLLEHTYIHPRRPPLCLLLYGERQLHPQTDRLRVGPPTIAPTRHTQDDGSETPPLYLPSHGAAGGGSGGVGGSTSSAGGSEVDFSRPPTETTPAQRTAAPSQARRGAPIGTPATEAGPSGQQSTNGAASSGGGGDGRTRPYAIRFTVVTGWWPANGDATEYHLHRCRTSLPAEEHDKPLFHIFS